MTLFEKIRGRWRLMFGFCPKCNSDAPDLYECNVCQWYRTSERGMPNKKTKTTWWNRFITLNK